MSSVETQKDYDQETRDYEAFRRRQVASLTPGERQVARWVARGLTNRAIAARLGLTPNTVSKRVSEILDKLTLRSRQEIGPRLALYGGDIR